MKTKWLITDVTAVEPPDRAERANLGVIVAAHFLSWPIQAIFVVREPLCDVGTPSRALISLLRVI